MRSFVNAAIALISATSVAATNFTVVVGQGNSLTFNPTVVTAKNGDNIVFQFASKNHSATQSTFAKPCERMTTPQEGADSGFMAVDSKTGMIPTWEITITNDSTPLWFFCAQKPHCEQAGMVFAVNPSSDKPFDRFQKTAMGAAVNGTATNGTTSASGNGSGSTAGSTGGASGGASSTGGPNPTGTGNSDNNGAMSTSINAAGLFSIAGLVAGLLL